ncbi:hypothetical protein CRM22_006301 [Opisthorchis felineus]|uniref:SCP domain-containing protein n=1 Tax=Opisthorchis felineus TaxID=147828 RepID=A0A4V3SEI1_OPIFE|nr:hypothetical protein CRM22_006301 [Opisthorchis felineus]
MDEIFNRACLLEHNRLREKHGCPPLTLDSKLTKDAQEYAEFLAKVECFVHSSGDHGENMSLRVGFGKLNITGEEVTNLWYSEIENYKYGDNVQMECGHFTQVVWKDTKKAGFGRAYTKDGRKIYVVGRYHPPGNYQGCCKLNVPRPIN